MDPFGLFVVLAPYILITGIVGAQWFSRRQFRRFIPRFLGIFLGYMVGVAGALAALFAGFMASSLLAPQYETVDPNVFLVATIAGVFVATVFMTWLLGQLLLLLIALPRGASAKRSQKRIGKRSIFMSYRRADSSDIAGRIYDRLVEHFGSAAVFRDLDSIPHGRDFRSVLERTLERCPVVLVLIGPRWVDVRDHFGQPRLDDPHDFVRREVEQALERAPVVIPVLLNHTELPDPADLPVSMQELVYHNAATIRPDPDFHTDMNRLIRSIEGALDAVK